MREILIYLALLIPCIAGARSSLLVIEGHSSTLDREREQLSEARYLPRSEAVQLVSFGYRNALAQLLWFKTISYFGKHFRADQNYRWLSHMCTLVTELNPRAEYSFVFCANMLAWEAKDVVGANAILSSGLKHDPANWYYHYLRGFNYTFFLKDNLKARDDFVAAAALPGAHPLVIKLAAKKLSELESAETAIEFLEEAISRTQDPSARQALQGRLARLRRQNSMQGEVR